MENLCPASQGTCVHRNGGYAERVRANARFVIPIPEALKSEHAAPLLCGGITVYNPLRTHGVNPSSRVGVIGIGGLGHLAVQFAAAWGARVTAFSNSPEKTAEIKRLGATTVVSSRDTASWAPLAGTFDLIMVTVGVPLDWDKIIALLAPNGKLHIVGVLAEPIPIPVLLLLIGQRSLSSSLAGSRGVVDKMLRFAAQHHIAPITEHFPMSKANEAIDKIESGKAAYRVVLDADF